MIQFKRAFVAKFLTVCATSVLLSGCFSTRYVNQQSEVGYHQIINKYNQQKAVDKSSKNYQRINHIFQRLRPIADAKNQTGEPFKWELNVIKSKEVNAWAMSGGKMVVFTGLIDKLKLNDNEIAVVMGHEMSHVALGHGRKKYNIGANVQILKNLGVAAVAVAVPNIGAVGMSASQAAIDLAGEYGVNAPYSRSYENEADELGMMIMAEAGYDPSYAPKLWEKMSKMTGDKGGIVLLSTHPSNEQRQEHLQALLPKAMEIYRRSPKAR